MKKIKLVIIFSLVILMGALIQFNLSLEANAQIKKYDGHSHSLKELLQERKIGDAFECPNPLHTLVLRPNSNWACVYPETASKLKWDVVLYTKSDSPIIIKSIFYDNSYHSISYQTSENVVNSVKFDNTEQYNNKGYKLEITITPYDNGEINIVIPSLESDIFPENYCFEFNKTLNSHFYFFLVDGQEALVKILDTSSKSMNVQFPYAQDAKLIEIILACHI
ncbi:hypothetical protein [Nitrosopumilus piranensis]|uniref:Uncharacterized protein n=1 Tax=Nitrosopumilus piranensis TaxID=1582439 RepID=A0A0C5BXU0_9ARCH|nr:hypothetical protein [Nitrosopumilus piranensis]AJM93109.1 exported protein of unknown function [Nitrosopumilus piranensis]